MSRVQGARARARVEITAAIKDAARRQLAEEGVAKLSLRAVARELGMVSSAVYRYFPSRDDLLTALIIDSYNSLGQAAEDARDRAAEASPLARWTAVCEAVRAWALAHPHEYALIYGTPVPGYTAPRTTVPAAARVGLVLIGIARDAHERGELTPAPLPEELRPEAERQAADVAHGVPPEAATALVAAWSELAGLVGFELFGQFEGVVARRDAFFRWAVRRLGRSVGLTDGDGERLA